MFLDYMKTFRWSGKCFVVYENVLDGLENVFVDLKMFFYTKNIFQTI